MLPRVMLLVSFHNSYLLPFYQQPLVVDMVVNIHKPMPYMYQYHVLMTEQ